MSDKCVSGDGFNRMNKENAVTNDDSVIIFYANLLSNLNNNFSKC